MVGAKGDRVPRHRYNRADRVSEHHVGGALSAVALALHQFEKRTGAICKEAESTEW